MTQWCKVCLLASLAGPSGLWGQGVLDLLPLAGALADSAILDPALALIDHRRAALAELVAGPRAPLDSQRVFGVRYFPYDPTLAFEAVLRPNNDTALVNFPTSDGRARAYRAFGELIFLHDGAPRQLTVYELPGLTTHPLYGDLLFLPFFDESNGETTYGGGRYLDLSRAAFAAGDYRLDFNRAYNPWCAYADGFSCPVPPLTNALPFAVHAGEAAFVDPAAEPHTDRPAARAPH